MWTYQPVVNVGKMVQKLAIGDVATRATAVSGNGMHHFRGALMPSTSFTIEVYP